MASTMVSGKRRSLASPGGRHDVSIRGLRAHGAGVRDRGVGADCGDGQVRPHLLAAYAIGQALNVTFPHAIATLVMRTYAPGLLTGLAFVLPAAIGLVSRSLSEGQLRPGRLVVVSVGFIIFVVASIPLLFGVGTMVEVGMSRRRRGV